MGICKCFHVQFRAPEQYPSSTTPLYPVWRVSWQCWPDSLWKWYSWRLMPSVWVGSRVCIRTIGQTIPSSHPPIVRRHEADSQSTALDPFMGGEREGVGWWERDEGEMMMRMTMMMMRNGQWEEELRGRGLVTRLEVRRYLTNLYSEGCSPRQL